MDFQASSTSLDNQFIKLSLQPNLLFEGAFLEIMCESTLSNPTEVCWLKDDTKIVTKENSKFSNGTCQNPSLFISDLQKIDSGTYNCKITNGFGYAERTIYIQIKEQESKSFDDIIKRLTDGKGFTFPNFESGSKFTITPSQISTVIELLSFQRICVLSIKNKSGRKLSNIKRHVQDGRETHSVESIDNGKENIFTFTTEGTVWHIRTDGVLTFDVEGTNEQIAILWSVPFWNKNQYDIKINPQDSRCASESLYKTLLEGAPPAGDTINKEGDGYTITAKMSKHNKAHLWVKLETIV